jgi:hypothetical protein
MPDRSFWDLVIGLIAAATASLAAWTIRVERRLSKLQRRVKRLRKKRGNGNARR